MPRITVKWGMERLELDASPDINPRALKDQLHELTGVPPKRQRVIIKGKQIHDDLAELNLHDGATIMLMGTVEAVPSSTTPSEHHNNAGSITTTPSSPPPPEGAPNEQANSSLAVATNGKQQMNDGSFQQEFFQGRKEVNVSTDAEMMEAPYLPVGLENLSPCCFMHAVLQAYRAIPELCDAIRRYVPPAPPAPGVVAVVGQPAPAQGMAPAPVVAQLPAAAAGAVGQPPPPAVGNLHHRLTQAVHQLFADMDARDSGGVTPSSGEGEGESSGQGWMRSSGDPLQSIDVQDALERAFPQLIPNLFSRHPDASECFEEMLRALGNVLTIWGTGRRLGDPAEEREIDNDEEMPLAVAVAPVSVTRLFECELRVGWKRLHKANEPVQNGEVEAADASTSAAASAPVPNAAGSAGGQLGEKNEGAKEEITVETQLQLCCHLRQGVSYLQLGLRSQMASEMVERAPAVQADNNDGDNAPVPAIMYEKRSALQRLPAYLCIKMERFVVKEKTGREVKALKDVKFPINLDVYDLCTAELRERLQPMRDRYKLFEEEQQELRRKAKLDVDNRCGDRTSRLQKGIRAPPLQGPFESTSFEDDPGSNNSGLYELKAVITHKGRRLYLLGEHYIAWVRINGQGNHWALCDDTEVHPICEEDLLKLSGGCDWPCAYVLVYGPRPLPIGERPSNVELK